MVRSGPQPRMIPNPLYCETCKGRGYLVADAEWEPYAVECADCKDRRRAARDEQLREGSDNAG